jgi:hypothetical protein
MDLCVHTSVSSSLPKVVGSGEYILFNFLSLNLSWPWQIVVVTSMERLDFLN